MSLIFDLWMHWLAKLTSWRGWVVLLVGCIGCFAGFKWRNNRVAPALTPDGQMLKLDSDTLLNSLTELGSHQGLYAITEVTLDLAFPLLYTALLSVPLLMTFGKRMGALTLIPLGAGCFDLVENFTLTWLVIWGNLQTKTWLIYLALWAGKTKMIMFYLALGMMILALAVAALKRLRVVQSERA